MPFQDVEEITSQESPKAPSSLARILRRVFVEDWSLKLLSLAITLVLWFVVTGQNTPVSSHATVQLKFIRPEALEISNDPPRSVDVLLTGSKYKLDEINRTSLIATVDISDQRAGERVLRLMDRADLELPQGVTVDGFQPSAISVRLEPIIRKQLQIEPRLEGTPATGYEVYGVRLDKNTVTVQGPVSNVNALTNAPTETISVADRRESFNLRNVSIAISDPKIDLLEPSATVEVEIGETRIEKEFANVEVVTQANGAPEPNRTTLVVYGPPSALAALKPTDLKLVLPSDGDVTKASLQLPSQIQSTLTIRSVTPSKFKIKG